MMMTCCSKMLSTVAMLVLTIAMVVVEAQQVADCATKLTPCADALNSTTTPAKECCDSMSDAITNDLACLCNLYTSGTLTAIGINLTEAVLLPKRCGLSGDLSGCNNINGTSNTNTSSSVPPPPPAVKFKENTGVIEIGAEGVTTTITQPSIIGLEQGWGIMQKGITKLTNILEGLPEEQFSSEEYMTLYTTIYDMCTQQPPHDYSQQVYDKYRESFEEYISSMVLPPLREKQDEFLLRELVQRWLNHKIMVRWLSRFFNYLDRYFIPTRSLLPLNEVGLTCFRDLVYHELNGKVRDVVTSLIEREREGEQIDQDLLKNVLDIFVEIGMGQMNFYENDFEVAMLKDTTAYYSRKASYWILEDSSPDYMLKVIKIMKREKERVDHYLHPSSETKLLEKVQHELLSVYATQLLENDNSKCHALLRDDKVGELSRMYNKGVVGSSTPELLATFCDNMLIKGGSEKISDEGVTESLEKVDHLLAYMGDKDRVIPEIA